MDNNSDKQKLLTWGQALFFGDRTTYYQLPPYFLCKVIDATDDKILLQVGELQVWKELNQVIRVGKKIVAFQSFYDVFQKALHSLENSLSKLSTYDLLVKDTSAPIPAVDSVVVAEMPSSTIENDWEKWEVDTIIRTGVVKHNKKLLQLSNGEYIYQNEALVCTEEEWAKLEQKYQDVIFAQKNLLRFLEVSVQTYEQFTMRSQQRSKLSRKNRVLNKENAVYETLVKYPQLSLRQIGEQIGFSSSENIFIYYKKLKATLPLEKVELILRPGDTIIGNSRKKVDSINSLKIQCSNLEKEYAELLEKNQQLLKEINEYSTNYLQLEETNICLLQQLKALEEKFNLTSETYFNGNTNIIAQIKMIISKYEEMGITKGQGRSGVRNCLNELWDMVSNS